MSASTEPSKSWASTGNAGRVAATLAVMVPKLPGDPPPLQEIQGSFSPPVVLADADDAVDEWKKEGSQSSATIHKEGDPLVVNTCANHPYTVA